MKSYCLKEQKRCVNWIHKYFKDCLCNVNDDLSFSFGIISLLSWGVAEIPQIFTNFRTKSSHGVSILFLIGWVLGDIFNLVGCILEPATLPTQFYTAFLYTASTIVLVLQSLYYDYFYKWLKRRHNVDHQEELEDDKEPRSPKPTDQRSSPIASTSVRAQTQRYYTSARSLAGSGTPPFRSYLTVGPRGVPSVLGRKTLISYDEEETSPIPLPLMRGTTSLPKQIPRPAAGGVMMATTVSLPLGSHALSEAYRGLSGRRLLSENSHQHRAVGQWLGWMMAAIYTGGRIPQIFWNMKRGSVEGLNPLMFVFALIANVAYIASILVRRPDLKEIKANLPWLLDAIVCVVLDLFIIMQYVYYKHIRKRNAREEDRNNYHEEAQNPVAS